MKTILHTSESRGYANHGWLKSYHSFSFAGFFNPEKMNFGALRVLNDDVVQSKMGFGTHPHQNMEIISIPLKGALSHKDSMNNKRSIETNEVQVMSAGTGLTHSEFNDSKTDEVNFLQIWILPEEQGVKPNYEQKVFDANERENTFQTLISPKDKLEYGSLGVCQQAYIKRGSFDANQEIDVKITPGNGIYLFLIEGAVEVENQKLSKRDAVGVSETSEVHIKANDKSDILLIEVPMISI